MSRHRQPPPAPYPTVAMRRNAQQNDPVTLGELIRRRRLDRGWRQEDLAKHVGCSPRLVTSWENDTEIPKRHLPIVERILDIKIPEGLRPGEPLPGHREPTDPSEAVDLSGVPDEELAEEVLRRMKEGRDRNASHFPAGATRLAARARRPVRRLGGERQVNTDERGKQ